MNTFYKTISKYYNYIFPYNEQQLTFIQNNMYISKPQSILEVGCATGNLTFALKNICPHTYGIDLDCSLLNIAKSKPSAKEIIFNEANMLHIDSLFQNTLFDGIICFGNTLVHLNNLTQIEEFIQKASGLLSKNGTLILQTINYDRIIKQNIRGLPTIDNETISFTRKYKYLNDINKIEFSTELLIKETNEVLTDSQLLYPLLQIEIDTILKKYFNAVKYYGNFNNEEFNIEKSQPLIIVAQ